MSQVAHSALKTYQRLLQITRKHWVSLLIGVVGTLVLSGVDALLAWLIKPIVNKGFIDRDVVFIHWLPLLIVMVFVARGVSGFCSDYFVARVARHVVMELRQTLFQKLLQLPAAFYDRTSSGFLLSTLIYNVEQVAAASSDVLLNALREGSLAVGLVVVMFVVNWQLTLMFLAVTPVMVWVLKRNSSRLRRLSTSVQSSMGEVTHVVGESIEAYKVIRLFGGQRYETEKFERATQVNRQRELKVVVTNSIGTSMIQILISLPIAGLLFLAIGPGMGVSAGSFASVVSAMLMLLRPVRRVTQVNNLIQKGIAGAQSIFTLLDEPVEPNLGAHQVSRVKGEIVFDQVSFSYDALKGAVLNKISFTVQPGEVVAIVGKSGSGKTTLLHLLPRFYELQSGTIKVDGVDIRDYDLQSLRDQFSIVTQEAVLFNDTIANNIGYAASARDVAPDPVQLQNALEKAATDSFAIEFIERLPDAWQTSVGEDGVLLSGGQRQRVALARAFFKKAPILILDEATSALDTYAERHIQSALTELMQSCTTLVIAHRLSTIENADRILVMDQGEIVEFGTHAELLKRSGVYAMLYQTQFQTQMQEDASAC